jgi:alpha-L-fucosidase
VDGHPRPLALPAGAGTARLRVRRDPATHPYAMQLELTPMAPFHQGDRLPATVESVELVPVVQHDPPVTRRMKTDA